MSRAQPTSAKPRFASWHSCLARGMTPRSCVGSSQPTLTVTQSTEPCPTAWASPSCSMQTSLSTAVGNYPSRAFFTAHSCGSGLVPEISPASCGRTWCASISRTSRSGPSRCNCCTASTDSVRVSSSGLVMETARVTLGWTW